MYNNINTAFDVMKEFMITGAEFDGKYDIPIIPACSFDYTPKDSIDFEESFSRKIKNHRRLNVNFYIDDVKFIVGTSWLNNKTTSSTGSEYTVSNSEVSLASVELRGDTIIELKVGDTYTDQGVIVLDNLSDATNNAHVEITIINSKNETVNLVDTSSKDTFKIKYTVVYKNSLYT